MSAASDGSPWVRLAGEMVVPALLLGYATHYYLHVARLPRPETNLLLIEPAYWLLLACCGLFAMFRLHATIAAVRRGGAQRGPIQRGGQIDPIRAAAFVVLTGLYIWFIPVSGFVTATLGYAILMLLALGVRSWLVLVLTPTLLAGALWVGMDRLLNLRLPQGLFF